MASFICSSARAYLYTHGLNRCQQDCVYADTDSLCYISREQNRRKEPRHATVGHLGEFVSELPPEDFIYRFVSPGCKSYSYITYLWRKIVSKYKGIRMTAKETKEIVNEKSFWKLARREMFQNIEEIYEGVSDNQLKARLMEMHRKKEAEGQNGAKPFVVVPDPKIRELDGQIMSPNSEESVHVSGGLWTPPHPIF